MAYTYAKITSGRNTLVRTSQTLPGSYGYSEYFYKSTGNSLDLDAGRVTQLEEFWVTGMAAYDYNGVASLVGTTLNEPDVMWKLYTTTGVYPDLDVFNRVTSSRWTKDLATDRDFVDLDVAYDRNSNITRVVDNVHTTGVLGAGNGLFDAGYSIDDLNRLFRAQEGNWNGSAIDNQTRDEQWRDATPNAMLTQTGNWERYRLNLNSDADFTDTGELDEDRTHNIVNELTGRDTDDNGTDNYTLTYDANGNLTDDGKDYEYVYDAFGRVRQAKRTDNQAVVAAYRYNGLGFRISYTYDTDHDADVDANDQVYYWCYDEQWRQVATFRGSDANPKERFVHHAAGLGGEGGSSYIDGMVLRDKDANTAWTSAADSTMEQRRYYCQNWRADVSALVTEAGKMVESVKYSSYGVAHALPTGDTDSDGDWDATDSGAITGSYDIRKDAELDGDVDANDVTQANAITGGYQTLGRGVLSSASVVNLKGYAGYVRDAVLAGTKYHVRHRVLDSESGRRLQRSLQNDFVSYAPGKQSGSGDALNPCAYCARDQCCTDCCQANWPNDPVVRGMCESGCLQRVWHGDCFWAGSFGNCYRYAISCQLKFPVLWGTPAYPNPGHQLYPGQLGGHPSGQAPPCGSCGELHGAVLRDYLVVGGFPIAAPPCSGPYYAIRAVIGFSRDGCDFHFFRQHPDGNWTDKPGCGPVSPSRPLPGLPYAAPGLTPGVPFMYTQHCGYFCVPYAFTCEPP